MVLIDPDKVNRDGSDEANGSGVRVMQPKRVLHFSDGVLEEYSTDEEEVDSTNKDVVDPATLTWGPWFWYKAWMAGTTTLSTLDTVGEFLASLFGITTPRYYFELEEYKRREEQMKNRKDQEEGWSEPATGIPLNSMMTKQPEPVNV